MKKILYMLPGFGQSPTDIEYKALRRIAEKKGYSVQGINLRWAHNTLATWVHDFENILSKSNTENATIVGFSFGAMIAILASQKYTCKKLILCSPSPYFKEDLQFLPQDAKKWIGTRRLKSFAKHPFPKNNTTPAIFIMGDADWSFGLKRIRERSARWQGKSTLYILKGVQHNIGDPVYLKKIEEIL